MTTLHVLSNPYGTVNYNNRIDPFSIGTWKFIHWMTRLGWRCIHYSTPGTEVDCETVPVLSELSPDQDHNTLMYNQNAANEIAKRKNPDDIIVCCYGTGNQIAANYHTDLKIVEPFIGYSTDAVFAPYRVFASYAHMHMFYGDRKMLMSPSWTDAVIPNAISASEFEFSDQKDDYILYFGRVIESKGVRLAIHAAEAAGVRLIIAGPGSIEPMGFSPIPQHVEIAGPCNIEQRRKLMSRARAIIGPTYYVEPFGNMVVEGYMSGTPAITTDWGAFTETVVQGITGYRCREFREFVQAIQNIHLINPHVCRRWAMENCEDAVVHQRLDEYFKRIIANNFYR